MDITVLPVIIAVLFSGGSALIGALGSHWISGRNALRAKRLELFYQRRAEVYTDFLAKQSAFVHFPGYKNLPTPEELYVEYLHAYRSAQLFASARTYEILTSENGPNHSIQRM